MKMKILQSFFHVINCLLIMIKFSIVNIREKLLSKFNFEQC